MEYFTKKDKVVKQDGFSHLDILSNHKEFYIAYKTVSKLKLWNWFRNEEPPNEGGYMCWENDELNKIDFILSKKLSMSRFFFAFLCQHMQYIARYGVEQWANEFKK